MNLPLLTAKIGEAWADDDIFNVLYQEPKLKKEEDKDQYIAFMVFDLIRNEISFDMQPYNGEAIRRYKYFGNNKAAAIQFHVVREEGSFSYFMGLWKNLLNLLKTYELKDLLSQLNELVQAGLIEAETGCLIPEKISYAIQNPDIDLKYDANKKKFLHKIGDKTEEITMEVLVRRALAGTGKDQILLMVPQILKEDGELIDVSNHEDYLELIKQIHKLDIDDEERVSEEVVDMPEACYICGLQKDDLNCAGYSTKLRRDGINKVFTTTTINYAKNIEKQGYDDNYSFCKQCFDKLRQGEKIILNHLTTRLAGERTFILPEGLLNEFEYENINEIKQEVDFIFKPREAELWINGIGAQTRLLQVEYFNLNFIVYDTDGNSITVLQTISDINSNYLMEIINTFKKHLSNVTDHLKYFSLGSIYHVIPVKTTKKGNQTKQVDAGRVLSFYKSILKREKVKTGLVHRYALEALDKGLKQLAANKIRNYSNLNLITFMGGWEDFYIKRIIFSYLVILQAMQELDILSGQVFMNCKEGEGKVMYERLIQDKCPDSILDAEKFLEDQHFISEARALFYLGLMLKRVAIAQASKGHKTKPILKKVNFQGMSQKDVLRFYEELVEKLRQYNIVNFYTEWLMNRFHHYMGSALTGGEWYLSEHANVFYIMAGYAFQVGKKSSPDLSNEEQKTVIEENTNISSEEEEDNGNTEQ